MLNLIKKILDASDADDYEITETIEEGWEFYFIRHKLDQNRAKDIKDVKVKVYKKSDDGEFLGNAVGVIPPTATEEEMKKMIDDLVYQASLVKNPYYEILSGDGKVSESKSDVNVSKISKDFIDAFNSVNETTTEDLNSYEIFVSKKTRHFLNSRGVERIMTYPSSLLEVVTNARNYAPDVAADGKEKKDKKEIELYRLYRRGTCDRDALIYDVEELLNIGKDKLIAVDTPAIKKAPLIMSTDDAVFIYDYFLGRVGAANKYMGISDCEIGKAYSDDIKGDKVSLKVLPELPNSSTNFLYDEEGSPVKERYLIKDGTVENYWGSRQFSQYLGLNDSSAVYNYSIEGGTKTADELRTGPYLEVVEFSGFDCDTMTGDIAGEIRLGYWHDGKKITPVCGGSVSGSMMDFAKEMYMSKELRQYNNTLIPAVTRLENANITGIE